MGSRRATRNGTLRLTSRQAFQLHGVLKGELKPTIAAMNAALVDTIAACGDVNRNVLASPGPAASTLHAEAQRWAARLSEHLLPRTRAYHEIWLDGKKVAPEQEEEPILGANYLPRKFKAAIAVPPVNDVDVFAQDLGFIAIVEDGRLAGFNLTVGGGLGATHGDREDLSAARGRRSASWRPDQLLAVAEAVVTTQRDFGDRSERKHARLKYTIADRGLDWFRAELERRLGFALAPRAAVRVHDDRRPLRLERGCRRAAGTSRCASSPVAWPTAATARLRSGLARIAQVHRGHFRLTPNQNLIIADVAAGRALADRRAGRGLRARCAPQVARRSRSSRSPASRCRPARWRWPRPNATCPP